MHTDNGKAIDNIGRLGAQGVTCPAGPVFNLCSSVFIGGENAFYPC